MHMSVALLIFFFFRTYAPRACVRADVKQHVVERRTCRGVRVAAALGFFTTTFASFKRRFFFFLRSKSPRTVRFRGPSADVRERRVVNDVRDASSPIKVAENFNEDEDVPRPVVSNYIDILSLPVFRILCKIFFLYFHTFFFSRL